MKFWAKLTFVLCNCAALLAEFTSRSYPDAIPAGKIVGGHEAEPHYYPFMVSLQLRFLWVRAHICGGSLLNENWVLTAGHCIGDSFLLRWLAMDAVAGTHDVDNFSATAQINTIVKKIPHPQYRGDVGPNDIAVLKTKKPFMFTQEIQPIRIPTGFKNPSNSLKLTGWGVTKSSFFFPSLPSKLQEVDVTYIPYDECYRALEEVKEEYEENTLNKDANICTGPLTGGIAACNGDSGGPLIQNIGDITEQITNDPVDLDRKSTESPHIIDSEILINNSTVYNVNNNNDATNCDDQSPVVIGIVSWGVTPCGEKGAPSVYTKVAHYVDFINQHIKH